MSDSQRNNDDLINFIAASVESLNGQMTQVSGQMETMRGQMETMRGQMATMRDQMATKEDLERAATKEDLERFATKDDLERFATKDDLERFATKEDLERFATKEDLERFATKEDLERFATKEEVESVRDEVSFVAGQIETMRDQMATKDDLARLEERLTTRMDAQFTAIRGDIEQTHLRLDSVERVFASRVDRLETELSRMRSVLYLLVKDKPDMLRLLGQAPPAGGEGRP